MKIYSNGQKKVPFSKWCEENGLSLRVLFKDGYYTASFSPSLYDPDAWTDDSLVRYACATPMTAIEALIRHSAGQTFFYQRKIGKGWLFDKYETINVCFPGGLYLDFDDINTQEVVNV